MIDPKPLTKEQRLRIEQLVNRFYVFPSVDELLDWYHATKDLLADSAFWRGAVKKTNPYNPQDKYGEVGCAFCGSFGENHKPNCSWLAAQELP